MKHRNVWVSVRGRQMLTEAFWEETMDMVTSGTLSYGPEGYTLTYMEDADAGMGRTQTAIQFGGGNRVVMRHSGEVNTHMIFEKGCKHVSYYDTDMGALTLGVTTKSLRFHIGGGRGGPIDLELEYMLEIDNEVTGANTLNIRISDRNGDVPIDARPPASVNAGDGTFLN